MSKAIVSLFMIILFCFSFKLIGQNLIHDLPSDDVFTTDPDINDVKAAFNILDTFSENLYEAAPIVAIHNTHVDFSIDPNDNWPPGTWGRGFYTQFVEYRDNDCTKYKQWFDDIWSCIPLTRHTARRIIGYAHACYNPEYASSVDLFKIYVKQGLDYLIEEQQTNGEFFNYWERKDKYDPSHGGTKNNEYSSYIALRAMTDGYELLNSDLVNDNTLNNSLINSINLTCAYLEGIEYTLTVTANTNNRFFAVWALIGAYKVTGNLDYYEYARKIADIALSYQRSSSDPEGDDGSWKSRFTTDPDYVWHDSNSAYHGIILRGLAELYSEIPDSDQTFKNKTKNSIIKSINHIIDYNGVVGTPESRLFDNSGDYDGRVWLYHRSDNTYYGYPTNYSLKGDFIIQSLLWVRNNMYFSNEDNLRIDQLINGVVKGLIAVVKNVSGDFDSRQYESCEVSLHSLGLYLDYLDGANIYHGNPYEPLKITNRVISGDFDEDGKEDDIAAFYDYGDDVTKIHVWTSTGTSFEYNGSNSWWSSGGGYKADKIAGRVVCGDFDNDGFKDDIAAFYDYGNNVTKIHVWKSTGSSFQFTGTTTGWWNSSAYNATKITGRVISGDFDRDGKHDDIATFYDYGSDVTKIHVWKSTGSSFQFTGAVTGWWNSSEYNATKVTGRVISGDFDRDGKHDDIATFYDYGSNLTKIHVWKSTGSSFQFTGAVTGWWNSSLYSPKVIGEDQTDEVGKNYPTQYELFNNYPNPFNPTTTIKYSLPKDGFVSIKIFTLLGKEVSSLVNKYKSTGIYTVNWNANNFSSGIYILKMESGNYIKTRKLMLIK